MNSQPSAEQMVAQDTALLVPILRALLADPQVDPVRLSRAADLYGLGNVERQPDGTWLVVSACNPEQAYLVDARMHTCSCLDYANRQPPCKHVLSCRIFAAAERAEAERLDPTLQPISYELTAKALAYLGAPTADDAA